MEIGLFDSDIKAVFLEGSFLYVKEPRDIDLVVITKEAPKIAKKPEGHELFFMGLRADVNLLSIEQFYNIASTWHFQFFHEEEDWVCVYGDPSCITPHELTPERIELEKKSFEETLFKPESSFHNPKRLVTFFVFAKKMGEEIPDGLIEAAHREELDPADFRWLFNKLFTNYSPKVHQEN